MSSTPGAAESDNRYIAVQQSPEFADLRRRFRRFVFPVTAFFLAWYFLYVLLSTYAPDFMATKVVGNVNIGLLMGLGQFVTTFAITFLYARWAGREFDPRADAIGQRLEGSPADRSDLAQNTSTPADRPVIDPEERP